MMGLDKDERKIVHEKICVLLKNLGFEKTEKEVFDIYSKNNIILHINHVDYFLNYNIKNIQKELSELELISEEMFNKNILQ